ncbi:hypothetical protein CCMSSC00406_0007606 [Pleurotus cornucopiae]|uniref:Uncharacterized protein n=1 Tax=Pleurotus cornucopiae TaxID=5321 RepID=A0ACB7J0P9_PLECO|nr:hypothetical protein CCMSSC00406_0007606 [Pleurotus cornucopiae]
MTSRIPAPSRYGLRSRKSRANDAPEHSESDLTDASLGNSIAETQARPTSAASRRSYSEVVAASLPTETLGPVEPSSDHGSIQETASGEKIAKEGVRADMPDEDDDDASTWTTVNRRSRRSHSTSSIDRRCSTLNVDQINTIDSAYDNLSALDKERLARRNARVVPAEHEIPPQEVHMKTPLAKEKGVDPRNWGNLNFENEDLDPVAQARALKLWKLAQQKSEPVPKPAAGPSGEPECDTPLHHLPNEDQSRLRRKLLELERENEKLRERSRHASRTPITEGVRAQINEATHRTRSKPKSKRNKASAGKRDDKSTFLPSSQIPPNSFLGRALNSIDEKRRSKRSRRRPSNDKFSGSSSSSSEDKDTSDSESEDSSSSSPSSSDSSDQDEDARRRRCHQRKKRSKTKSSLKPTPPEAYDGRADLTAFYRFVSDGTSYLKEGGVNRKYRVRKLATFLKGRAYDFYLQQVSMNPGVWTLRDFFEGLMNACFPVDLLEQTRSEIDRLWQRDLNVRDYSAQLKQKYDVIGSVSEQEKVVKLWNGFKPVIRAELYRERLNPNIFSWDEVVERAELLEVVETARLGRNSHRTPNTPNSKNQGRNRNGNDHSRNGNDKGQAPDHRTSGSNSQSSTSAQKPSGENKPKLSSQLSPKELEELRKAGKCFRCKREGHISKDCPSANSMKGSAGNRPPGLPSHAIDIDFEQHEALNTDDEPLHDLELGAVGLSFPWEDILENDSHSESEYSDMPALIDVEPPLPIPRRSWNTQYIPLGDLTLIAQAAHLDAVGIVLGFPGDDHFPKLWLPSEDKFFDHRFTILRISDLECVVVDLWYPSKSPLVFNYRLLHDKQVAFPYRYAQQCCEVHGLALQVADYCAKALPLQDPLSEGAQIHLENNAPFVGDEEFNLLDPQGRFRVIVDPNDASHYLIHDQYRDFVCRIPVAYLKNPKMNLTRWYNKNLAQKTWEFFFALEDRFDESDIKDLFTPDVPERALHVDLGEGLFSITYRRLPFKDQTRDTIDEEELWTRRTRRCDFNEFGEMLAVIELNGQQVQRGTYPSLQRNASAAKDPARAVPKPLVVTVKVNGHPARALLDSGSLGDFLSTTIVDQLGLKKVQLQTPLSLQLAVQGSRSKINFGCRAKLEYQDTDGERYFDVANIANYDIILGTPWMFQHKVTLGINPPRVVVGSSLALPLKGPDVTTLASRSMLIVEENIQKARAHLREYVLPVCQNVEDSPLPPLRAINHSIPLIDPSKIYSWRPSRCPEPLREQWSTKWRAYIATGRWQVTNSGNTVPMLLIYKPGTTNLRCVFDLRERNANTRKMTSPLPDIEGILRRVAQHKYVSSLDCCSAYEQIRVIPEHVERTAVTTPNGNMVSLVLQQGDCNGPATYQSLMNHLFSAYIGVFMDIYLDDIYIYSNSLEDHICHVKIIVDILAREKIYLSEAKMRFLVRELNVLGHVVDRDGIRMDTNKVDSILKWKTPTNRDLLRGFLGAVGYLADNIEGVRIPMGVLSSLTGDQVSFRWEFTHQRAFEDIKRKLHDWRDHHRVPLKYGDDAEPIWLITDGCATGISGVVAQGREWRVARVAAFYSAKLNPAQQNYPVHEIEMLAGVESMMRHRDILQGCRFKWLTDHKGLVHLLRQKNLSGRQARWVEKMAEFDFEPVYIPGVENVLSDALSRLYSNEPSGIVRAKSEYTYFDVVEGREVADVSAMPVLVGLEAMMASTRSATKADVSPERPAEAPRVESSAEFAKRMSKRRFVLLGPGERKEGGGVHQEPEMTKPQDKGSTAVKLPAPKQIQTENEGGPTEPNITKANVLPSSRGDGEIPHPSNPTLKDPPTLVDIVNGHADGFDLVKEVRHKYSDDPTFKAITSKPKEFRNFDLRDGVLYLKINGRFVLCIPHIFVGGRNLREIVIAEAHSLLAHLGAKKTLDYLREYVWWKQMVSDVQTYCDTCMTCRRSKPNNQKPFGLLHPLRVASRPWEAIGMDFVGPLPESKDRNASYDSITVVIDLLTAMVHLIPSRTNYTARHIAELVFSEIYKLHGLPSAIISDRDVLFTSRFWKRLHELIGTELRMSTAYHPQSDGSTERANRTITQLLRQCINPNQRDWVSKLPAIEFAINLARSDSTGFSPFFLNSGRMPRSMLWDAPKPDEFPGVRTFTERIRIATIAAHDAILAARIKQTRDANQHWRPAPFVEGDLVYLSTENIKFPKGLVRKFLPKYIGPYKILHNHGNESFTLDLPSRLKQRGIHNTFHASLLCVHVPNDDRLFPGRLDTQVFEVDDTDPEWAVEEILSHSGSRENSLFEIAWKSGDITWLPYDKVAHLQALQSYLDVLGVSTISELPRGTGTPPEDPQISMTSIFFPSPLPTSFSYLDETDPPSSAPPASRSRRSKNHRRPRSSLPPKISHSDLRSRSPSFDISPHPTFARVMSQLESGLGLVNSPEAVDTANPEEPVDELALDEEDSTPGNQTIPTATPLVEGQYTSRRDPTPHHKLQNVVAIDDLPYSFKFTNPLSGAQFVVTITDVWALTVVADHLRTGKHLDFYRTHYSDVYYNLAKCINQEPFLKDKNSQLPLITEDGLVLMLGVRNPSPVVLGLVDPPAPVLNAKDEVMRRPIPRYSKKSPDPGVSSSASHPRLPPRHVNHVRANPSPTTPDPLSIFARMNQDILTRGMVSYTEIMDKKLQRIEAAKTRNRANAAARRGRHNRPGTSHHHPHTNTNSQHIGAVATVTSSNGDITMTDVAGSSH